VGPDEDCARSPPPTDTGIIEATSTANKAVVARRPAAAPRLGGSLDAMVFISRKLVVILTFIRPLQKSQSIRGPIAISVHFMRERFLVPLPSRLNPHVRSSYSILVQMRTGVLRPRKM